MAYRKRVEFCDYPPTRVWIEASSDCNLQCSFCGNKQLTYGQRGFMDMDLYRRLADEASGKIRQFNLFHRGESLLNPRIGEMIRYARERGIRTRIHTNGTLLTPSLARDLIESRLGVLSISFDGYDRETYEANRANASFDQVLGNITKFLEIKKSLGANEPFTALESMEISNDSPEMNAGKRREFMSRFDGLPLDKFVIRKPHNWAGMIEIDSHGGGKSPKRIACPLLWHALVVFWDGTTLPCPQDFFGSLEIGNVNEQSLDEIWNGEALRSLRREMADPSTLARKPCVDCDRITRATFAGVPTDYLGRFISEHILGNSKLGKILPH